MIYDFMGTNLNLTFKNLLNTKVLKSAVSIKLNHARTPEKALKNILFQHVCSLLETLLSKYESGPLSALGQCPTLCHLTGLYGGRGSQDYLY